MARGEFFDRTESAPALETSHVRGRSSLFILHNSYKKSDIQNNDSGTEYPTRTTTREARATAI
jgi:hypothetical protein